MSEKYFNLFLPVWDKISKTVQAQTGPHLWYVLLMPCNMHCSSTTDTNYT